MNKYLIYTKPECSFCELTKQLLETYNLEYRERDISNVEIRQELLSRLPEAKTVPQIYYDGSHIGGYLELLEQLEQPEES